MALNCDPNALAQAATCFDCLSPNTQLAVQTYLLALLAGASLNPNTLAAQAAQFEKMNPPTLLEIQAYLLCQIATASGA